MPETTAVATLDPPPPPRAAAAPELLRRIIEVLEDGKAEEIVTIDLAGKSTIADYMVVATGRSARQVVALTDHLEQALPRPLPVEGKAQGDWVLVDAGDVIVHIFRPEIRAYYNLEKMWGGDLPDRAGDGAGDGGAAIGDAPIRLYILAVGRLRRGPLHELQALYAGRILPPPAIIEVEEKRPLPPAELKAREAELILAALPRGARLVALDERGAGWSSVELANRLETGAMPAPAPSPSRSAAPTGSGPPSSSAPTRCSRSDDDLAASAGARHAARTAVPGAADPRRPSVSPGLNPRLNPGPNSGSLARSIREGAT